MSSESSCYIVFLLKSEKNEPNPDLTNLPGNKPDSDFNSREDKTVVVFGRVAMLLNGKNCPKVTVICNLGLQVMIISIITINGLVV